jgi:hypothetical protein
VQGTVTSQSGPGSASAAFDPQTLTYSGTYTLGPVQIVQSRSYASLADFVTEPNVMGRILWTKEILTGAEQQTTTCTFDSDKRLVKKEMIDYAGTDGTTTLLEWDALGRPTRGLLSANPAELDCSGMAVTLSYDDTARRTTEVIDAKTGTGTACPKTIYNTYEVVNADGITVEMTHPGETTPTIVTVTQTAEQCLP